MPLECLPTTLLKTQTVRRSGEEFLASVREEGPKKIESIVHVRRQGHTEGQ